MCINSKDILYISFKVIIFTIFLLGILELCILDYHLGVGYCNLLHVPNDFAITAVSPGMALEVCILLFMFEIGILLFVIHKISQSCLYKNIKCFIINI